MTKINTLVLILVFTVSFAANSSLLAPYYFGGDDYFQFDKSMADWFATRGFGGLSEYRYPAGLYPEMYTHSL
jgi:hypothetical protein